MFSTEPRRVSPSKMRVGLVSRVRLGTVIRRREKSNDHAPLGSERFYENPDLKSIHEPVHFLRASSQFWRSRPLSASEEPPRAYTLMSVNERRIASPPASITSVYIRPLYPIEDRAESGYFCAGPLPDTLRRPPYSSDMTAATNRCAVDI